MNKFSDISFKYLKYNKKRSFSIIISIIIAVFFIFGIGTFGISIYNSFLNKAKANGDYVVVFNNVTNENYELLKENKTIDKLCAIDNSSKVTITQKKSEDKTLVINEFSNFNQEVFSYNIYEGNYPKNSNEIIIEDLTRIFLDKEYKIGDNITLNTEDEEKSYKIVGFYTNANTSTRSNTLSAITIKDKDNSNSLWNVYVNFKDNKDIKGVATNISESLGIKVLNYNDEILSLYGQSDNSSNIITLLSLLCCLIIFFSQLIIKNIIHMSVVTRTKDFGILKAIGISQKKLKKIVLKEAFILGIIAIFFGILFCFASLKIVEFLIIDKSSIGEYFNVEINPIITIISVFLIVIALILAILEPLKILKKISPLEAIGSNFAIKNEVIKRRKGGKIFNKIFGIEGEYAYKNLMRSKGKFISIILGFTISITLFITFNGVFKTYLKEISYNNVASYYDAVISLEEGFEKKISIENSIMELENIKGVATVNESYFDYSSYMDEANLYTEEYKTLENDNNSNKFMSRLVQGYNKDELTILKDNIVEGDFDVEKLKEDEAIICNYYLSKDKDGNSTRVKIYNINIGDEIAIIDNSKITVEPLDKIYEKARKTLYNEGLYEKVRVVAIVDCDAVTGDSPNIILSKEGFKKISSKKSNSVQYINIKLENGEISSELNKYINNNAQYSSIDYKDPLAFEVNRMKSIKLYINIITIAIGFVCALNIINSIATNQILRKREFATLRIIGMSKKGLCKMMILESTLASILASIFGIIIGNSLGYLFVLIASDGSDKYIVPYLSMLVTLIAVIGISLLLSIFSIVKVKKQSIVDGIKDKE